MKRRKEERIGEESEGRTGEGKGEERRRCMRRCERKKGNKNRVNGDKS